jgi:ethanolamine ammonia-lyase small subunit
VKRALIKRCRHEEVQDGNAKDLQVSKIKAMHRMSSRETMHRTSSPKRSTHAQLCTWEGGDDAFLVCVCVCVCDYH